MSTRNTLDDQTRRDRINRMKRLIIGILVFWMIFSLAAIVALAVITAGLSGRMKRLEKALTEVTAKRQEAGKNPGKVQETEGRTGNTESIQVSREEKINSGISDEENLAKAGDTHKVYLTFDGGPDNNTDAILDVLENQGVKATFFVNAKDSSKMKDIYRRIVADGHTLGMRSFSNRYSDIYASEKKFSDDLNKISDFLFKVTGMKSQYYRFPGGSGNEISNVEMSSLAQILNKKKIIYYDWNVVADDLAVDSTKEDVVTSVIKGVRKYKTSVVLLHEGTERDTTAKSLSALIDALQDMKAEILPIDGNTHKVQYLQSEQIQKK